MPLEIGVIFDVDVLTADPLVFIPDLGGNFLFSYFRSVLASDPLLSEFCVFINVYFSSFTGTACVGCGVAKTFLYWLNSITFFSMSSISCSDCYYGRSLLSY